MAAEDRMMCDVGDWLHDLILMKVKFPIYVVVSGRFIDPEEIFIMGNDRKRARSKRQETIDEHAVLKVKLNTWGEEY